MASNARNSVAGISVAGQSATSSINNDILSSENWQFVECCKCREDVLTQDASTGLSALRNDFWLLSCGHVACTSCLDGQVNCPKCNETLGDRLPVQSAQTNAGVAAYFQSTDAMLEDLNRTMQFQTSNLRDQTTYYKALAKKQSRALKGVKAELMELREMKKKYEALARENNALKAQLANQAQQEAYQPQIPQPRSSHSTPQMQHAFIPPAQPAVTNCRPRSGASTPLPLQAQTYDHQPQRSVHPSPMVLARQAGRSAVNTPQSGPSTLRNHPIAQYPQTIGAGKRKADDLMSSLSSSGHRIAESTLMQGAISSAAYQEEDERNQIAPQDQPARISPGIFDQFINPASNPQSRPRSAQAQHNSRRSVPSNQSLNTIPEMNPQYQQQQQYTNADIEMFQEAVQEQQNQQARSVSRQSIRQQLPVSNINNTDAREYTGHDRHFNPASNLSKQSYFKPLAPGNVPARTTDRSFPPPSSRPQYAGSRPSTAQGHRLSSGIAPMAIGPSTAQSNVLRRSPRRGGSGNSSFAQPSMGGGVHASAVKQKGFSYQNDQRL